MLLNWKCTNQGTSWGWAESSSVTIDIKIEADDIDKLVYVHE